MAFSHCGALITGAFSGVLESLLLLVGYILFPITYALFSLFYTLYGSILCRAHSGV